jgi:hypothetical protein
LPALSAVVVVVLITIRRFRRSAPKAENGFVAQENCFIAAAGRNILAKSSIISIEYGCETGLGSDRAE